MRQLYKQVGAVGGNTYPVNYYTEAVEIDKGKGGNSDGKINIRNPDGISYSPEVDGAIKLVREAFSLGEGNNNVAALQVLHYLDTLDGKEDGAISLESLNDFIKDIHNEDKPAVKDNFIRYIQDQIKHEKSSQQFGGKNGSYEQRDRRIGNSIQTTQDLDKILNELAAKPAGPEKNLMEKLPGMFKPGESPAESAPQQTSKLELDFNRVKFIPEDKSFRLEIK
ncbi:MAG: hypothetical protein LBQ83_00385 [Candidatus Margulisbacteria bacterium]|nr:hypothetical protein [Candidatus Margulisiibacteriota bacterium]